MLGFITAREEKSLQKSADRIVAPNESNIRIERSPVKAKEAKQRAHTITGKRVLKGSQREYPSPI